MVEWTGAPAERSRSQIGASRKPEEDYHENHISIGGVMARVDMEGIVDELDRNFAKVLKAVVDEVAPGNTVDEKTLMRVFRTRLERGFGRWEHVSDRYVDSGD